MCRGGMAWGWQGRQGHGAKGWGIRQRSTIIPKCHVHVVGIARDGCHTINSLHAKHTHEPMRAASHSLQADSQVLRYNYLFGANVPTVHTKRVGAAASV